MRRRASALLTPSLVQGLALVSATTAAFALDYLFNLLAGRLLDPPQFGIVVALAGAGQVLGVGSRVIQTVVTRFVAGAEAAARNAFFRLAFRRAWLWGTAVTILLLLLGRPIATFFRLDDLRPVAALLVTTVLLAVRPVVGGYLQGTQRFAALGIVQVVQAVFRLLIGVTLITLGLGAFGALAALPLASLIALGAGLWLLGTTIWRRPSQPTPLSLADLSGYGRHTAFGLVGFAILINMDAILVKRFFDPLAAGQYSAAITLGKVIQFFPLAIILLLFPKAARRRAARRSTAGVLLPALAVVGLLCGGITAVYFLFPELLLSRIFGPDYALPPDVLGLVGLAMTLLSLGNVWLNYFLSTEPRSRYVYAVWLGVLLQLLAILLFHESLRQLPLAMASNGAWLVLLGLILYLRQRRRPV